MDLQLVDRARRGDHDAFGLIVEPVYDRCYAVACRILGPTPAAQDATQQALLDIWDKLSRLRDVARFEAWCYRIVVNACYAETRRSMRAIPGPLPADHETATTADEFRTVVDRDQVERAFDRQRIEHRAVLVLRYYLDLPLEEIGAILEIPTGTVKSRIHNGLRSMRATIEADARAPSTTGPGLSAFIATPTTRWTS
ncbi:MAG: sigma-70 family RNA polymerase sigma factor [Chloroflexota bacterium]|nr:sigma-70 family RNA polymerase sigma factor [Chloroflexota bacterium]